MYQSQHQGKIPEFMSLRFLAVSKSFKLSVYVSTAKYEEMNQVTFGIASCKKKKCYYPNIQVVLKLQRNSKDGLIYFLSKMNNT